MGELLDIMLVLGWDEIGNDVVEWREHKGALSKTWMRKGQRLATEHGVAVKDNIEVDGAWCIVLMVSRATERLLDLLCDGEQVRWVTGMVKGEDGV